MRAAERRRSHLGPVGLVVLVAGVVLGLVAAAVGAAPARATGAVPARATGAVPARAAAPRLPAAATLLVALGQAPVVPPGTYPIGPVSGVTNLGVSVALSPRDPAALADYVQAVAEPSSPDYRHFLTPTQFADAFGPTPAAVQAVRSALTRMGLRPLATSRNDLMIPLDVSAAAAARAFHVSFESYRLPDRRIAFANTRAPRIPADLVGEVAGIDGLSDLVEPQREAIDPAPAGAAAPRSEPLTPQTASAASTGSAVSAVSAVSTAPSAPAACSAAQDVPDGAGEAYTADQLAGAYDLDGLYDAATPALGQGVTVAVVEYEPFSATDVAAFAACYLPSGEATSALSNLRVIPVDGGAGSGSGSGEAALDIEVLLQTAPEAGIEVYEGSPTAGSEVPTYNAIVSDDTASVVTTSWSSCESVRQAYAPGELSQLDTLFEEAAVQGQSVLAASGDSGAQGCLLQHSFVSSDNQESTTGSEPVAEAIDPAVSTVYVANQTSTADGSVGVLPESSTTGPYRTVGVTGQPDALWVDQDTHAAYVATSADQVVALTGCYVDTAQCVTGAVNDPGSLISAPAGLAGDPGFQGGQLYVANPGQHDVVVVSEAAHSVIGTVGLAQTADPALVALDPATHEVYVADNANDQVLRFSEPSCSGGTCTGADPVSLVSLSGPASSMVVGPAGQLYVATAQGITTVVGGAPGSVPLSGMTVAALVADSAGHVYAVGAGHPDASSLCQAPYDLVVVQAPTASTAATAGPCVPAQADGPVAVVSDPGSGLVFTADGLSHGVEIWNLAAAVQDPSSQPDVTAVGGTSLLSAKAGQPTEVAWNDWATSGGAGGGGPSSVWPIPAWQPRLDQSSLCDQSLCREVPDVSASADPYHGYAVYYQGSWQVYGGTSAATPLWAGITALAASSCPAGGVAGAAPARFGLLNPILYSLDLSHPQDFNAVGAGQGDIDYTGTNGDQPSTAAGYNMATGLGSPSATNLARDLCDDAVGTPSSVQFSVDSLAAAGPAAWTVDFVTGPQGALVAGTSTVSLSAPPGTQFPAAAADYEVQGVPVTAPPVPGVGGVTITVPVSVAQLTGVSVSVAAVTNPPAGAGPYPATDFSVSTSADTNPGTPPGGLGFSAGGLAITTSSLPAATTGQPYAAVVSAQGGSPPYTWSLLSGQLPAGLSLDAASGSISGVPDPAASSAFVIGVTDSAGSAVEEALDIGAPGTGATGTGSGSSPAPAPVVPEPPAGAVQPHSGTSTTPTGIASAVSGSASAVGDGEGALLVSSYASDPSAATPPTPAAGQSYAFFDVRAGTGSAFSVVTVSYCGVAFGGQLFWLDGATWMPVSPQSGAGGCVGTELSSTTTPAVGQLTGTVFAVAVATTPAQTGVIVARISGADREATAIAASQAAFPAAGSARAVVLARSDQYADALAGAPLAAHLDGPLLITSPTQLDGPVLAEIERVLAPGGQVYLLGGPAALAPAVQESLADAGFGSERIFGVDRYATAVAIAQELGPVGAVFEVTGLDFPDALAAGPAAIATGGAILLTDGSTQAPETAAYLAQLGPVTRYALGGPAAAADPGATPVVGSDRYATAIMVAQRFFRLPAKVGVATGLNFPDALAGGPLLGSSGPLLLVPSAGALPVEVSTYLQSVGGSLAQVDVFGGTEAVGPEVFGEVSTVTGAGAGGGAGDDAGAGV